MARIHRRTIQKKCLNDLDNHDSVITHLARLPGVWSQVGLRNHYYKASGGDGIPAELFQILKDDAVKVLHSICQHIWKTQQWPQDWKRSIFIPVPKKGNAKECSNLCTNELFSRGSKLILKILQTRHQIIPEMRTSRCIIWIYKKQRNKRSNCQHPLDHRKNKRISKKHLFLPHWLHQSLWLCGSQQTVESS